ncbi:tryptophan synthase, alpha chain [Desulfotomaculum arcticum]|uniref:Tryptophan synthase alpha chain n=1 Tax=Desulfotruncus arcticus DSM 17038 TaxID=1121424 RepID=A0A1I2Q8Z6_9FIRM|nr:tryptophan synthase subunit alpha [Desulfotruncus arcticus]SFG24834.1 tryptophan synthase, alpha chain [Desulfotomaculum arcticum] [Desulfotruncus arcticus DSM 17038]
MTKMVQSRITARLEQVLALGQKGLIAYITAGDPDLKTTVELAVAMAEAGTDVLELGVPFSDPVADGPTIQAASQRALAGGATVQGIIQAVEAIRSRSDIPLVLMTYYNPVLQYGPAKFAADLARAGGNGLIVPDLPPEESDELLQALDENGLDLIPLVTPNTPPGRLQMIAARARGFIYCVSVTGVTGERQNIMTDLSAMTGAVRQYSPLPVAVGFGISGPEQAVKVARHCDAVVVGSALVNIVSRRTGSAGLVDEVCKKVEELKQALAGPEVN